MVKKIMIFYIFNFFFEILFWRILIYVLKGKVIIYLKVKIKDEYYFLELYF